MVKDGDSGNGGIRGVGGGSDGGSYAKGVVVTHRSVMVAI